MSAKVQTILKELHRRLEALYGDRLVKVILFGSQARGNAEPDSDIDVAIILKGEVDPNIEIDRVVPITAQLSLDNDVLVSCASAAGQFSDKLSVPDSSPSLLPIIAATGPLNHFLLRLTSRQERPILIADGIKAGQAAQMQLLRQNRVQVCVPTIPRRQRSDHVMQTSATGMPTR